jgi:hypothetical protein
MRHGSVDENTIRYEIGKEYDALKRILETKAHDLEKKNELLA